MIQPNDGGYKRDMHADRMLYSILSEISKIVSTIFWALATLALPLALILLAAFLLDAYEQRKLNLRRAARDRYWVEYWRAEMARMRAWERELDAFARSLKPRETLLLQTFLCRHPSYTRIVYRRELCFYPHFSMSVLDTDWDRPYNLKTRQDAGPSMHEVITAALASFLEELALFRMRQEFAEKVLSRRLPCGDCCGAVAGAMTL